MNAQQIVDALAGNGIRLEIEGNRLRYYPKDKVDQDQIDLLRNNKQQIVQLLTATNRTDPTDWPETIDIRDVTPCPNCGSLELWETMAGTWRCLRCDPPTRWRKFAARHGIPDDT